MSILHALYCSILSSVKFSLVFTWILFDLVATGRVLGTGGAVVDRQEQVEVEAAGPGQVGQVQAEAGETGQQTGGQHRPERSAPLESQRPAADVNDERLGRQHRPVNDHREETEQADGHHGQCAVARYDEEEHVHEGPRGQRPEQHGSRAVTGRAEVDGPTESFLGVAQVLDHRQDRHGQAAFQSLPHLLAQRL